MAVHALLPVTDTVFVADNDKHVSLWLGQRMPDIPNIGDFTALDTLPDCDVLAAGFPCQPVSNAGKRKGAHDDRWLWDDIERTVGAMDNPPSTILLENVRGLLSANQGGAMARVIEGLYALGYVGRYGVLAAGAVGAPHKRERVFIVAHLADADRASGQTRVDAGHDRQFVRTQPVEHPADVARLPTPKADWKGNTGKVTRLGPYADAVARWEQVIGRPAPNPTEPAPNAKGNRTGNTTTDRQRVGLQQPDPDGPGDRGGTGRRLNPVFVEWMMGLPEGWVTDPTLNLPRTQQLRMLGNGVVPQQAQHAYRLLEVGQ